MVFVRLIGGLGNQMFEYATALAIAKRNKTQLKLDISSYSDDTLRNFELGCFNISSQIASKDDVNDFKRSHFMPMFIDRVTGYLNLPINNGFYLSEKKIGLDSRIFRAGKDAYINGYWQSEKYFSNISSDIKKEFSFRSKPNDVNSAWINKIQNSDSVAIHIRRGDYVQSKEANSFHGVCGLDYYKKAVDIVKKEIKNPSFFIFSDDNSWVKKNLIINGDVQFVDNNVVGCEDMRLMMCCKSFIIANSSFSWWAAWLSNSPDKIVVAPKKWFSSEEIDTKDLIPKAWIKI